MARKTAGDSYASMALANAFKDCVIRIQKSEVLRLADIDELLSFSENDDSEVLFTMFDHLCKHALYDTVIRMKDTNQPIIPITCFDAYVNGDVCIVGRCLPRLWKHL